MKQMKKKDKTLTGIATKWNKCQCLDRYKQNGGDTASKVYTSTLSFDTMRQEQ